MTRLIMHVDLDAFYAAIEQRDHPAWRGLQGKRINAG
jgi:DNA polymerase IV